MLFALLFSLSAQAMIHGQKARPEEAISRATVLIHLRAGSCTGTALSDRVILTAAHCQELGESTIFAVSHLTKVDDACSTAFVEEAAFAPGAVSEKTAEKIGHHLPDLILLKLKTPLCGVEPATLAEKIPQPGRLLWAAGYGKGTDIDDIQPDRMRLRLIPPTREHLEFLYRDEPEARGLLSTILTTFVPYYLLALPSQPGQSLCFGDSGGPVYEEAGGRVVIHGVNGRGAPHARKGTAECARNYLQFFTPVSPQRAWIAEKLADWRD